MKPKKGVSNDFSFEMFRNFLVFLDETILRIHFCYLYYVYYNV